MCPNISSEFGIILQSNLSHVQATTLPVTKILWQDAVQIVNKECIAMPALAQRNGLGAETILQTVCNRIASMTSVSCCTRCSPASEVQRYLFHFRPSYVICCLLVLIPNCLHTFTTFLEGAGKYTATLLEHSSAGLLFIPPI